MLKLIIQLITLAPTVLSFKIETFDEVKEKQESFFASA